MQDIALVNAVIAANVGINGKPQEVRVFRHVDTRVISYDFTAGACDTRWRDHPDHRLGFLHEIMWVLALIFKLPPSAIHSAVQCIPEYRALDGNMVTQR